MNRTLAVVVALLAVGCKNDTNIQTQKAELGFGPDLLDVGSTTLGVPASGVVTVDHLGGPDGRITGVELVGDDGEQFRFDGVLPIVVERGARVELPFTFTAEELGYYWTEIRIEHTGVDALGVVEIRGAALEPEVEVSPRVLDFGPVGVGQQTQELVTVSNRSDAPLVVTEAFVSDTVFTADVVLPLTVEAGRQARIPVVFAPSARAIASGRLELFSFDVPLPTVILKGNDCEGGVPEAYDQDDDGVTECGGDCDDLRADVRPGADEVPDGTDQDCDGTTDEGTDDYDDDGDGLTESRDGDCNDANADVNPGETEVIGNGIDDDCDGVVDVGGTDTDGDGWSPGGGDCDDGNDQIFPGAREAANGIDDDCDQVSDEGTVAYDDDGDGYCERSVNCTDGSIGGDCDDTAITSSPGAPEIADGRDNDCDTGIDEGTPNADDDRDGYTELGGDCDDADASMSPGLGTCP